MQLAFFKWCCNYAGIIKWKANHPQLREPLATSREWFHGALVENGWSKIDEILALALLAPAAKTCLKQTLH